MTILKNYRVLIGYILFFLFFWHIYFVWKHVSVCVSLYVHTCTVIHLYMFGVQLVGVVFCSTVWILGIEPILSGMAARPIEPPWYLDSLVLSKKPLCFLGAHPKILIWNINQELAWTWVDILEELSRLQSEIYWTWNPSISILPSQLPFLLMVVSFNLQLEKI